jgi:hypothetical protein
LVQPRQCRLATRSRGFLRQARRRAAGAGRSARRLSAAQAGLAIFGRLAKSDPGNAEWQRDLSVTHDSLAVVYAKSKQMPKAREMLLASRAVVARMAAQLPDSPAWRQELTRLDQQLAAFEN